MTRVALGQAPVLLKAGLTVPPVNVGPRSTNHYENFTAEAVHRLPGYRKLFAGQRAEGFHVDLGSIFDLGTLRPFENLHLIPSAAAVGVNGAQALNVHSIAIQVSISDLTRTHTRATNVMRGLVMAGSETSPARS